MILIVLYNLILKRPLILFATSGLIMHRGSSWIIFFLLSIPVEYMLSEYGRVKHAIAIKKSLLSRAKELREKGVLEHLSRMPNSVITDLITDYGMMLITGRYNWVQKEGSDEITKFLKRHHRPSRDEIIKVYYNAKKTRKIRSSFKAYTNHFSTNHIILNRKPEELSEIDRFLILHELAHANWMNIRLYTFKHSRKINLVFTIVIFSLLLGFKWILLLLAIVLAFYNLRAYDSTIAKVEANADAWALHQIEEIEDVQTIVDSFKLIWTPYADKEKDYSLPSVYSKRKQLSKEEILLLNDKLLIAQQYKRRIHFMKVYLKKRLAGRYKVGHQVPEQTAFEFIDMVMYVTLIYAVTFVETPSYQILIYAFIIVLVFVARVYAKLTDLEEEYDFRDLENLSN